MRASDICTRDVICVSASVSVPDAAKLMRARHAGALVVIEQPNGERIPVGMLTDRDIVLTVVAAGIAAETLTVGDIMSRPPVTCSEGQHLLEIIAIMRAHAIRRLPVLNQNGGLAGLVAADDVYSALGFLLHEINAAVTQEQTHEREVRT